MKCIYNLVICSELGSQSPCCGKVYPCRLCHDEQELTHTIDRFNVSEIECRNCSKRQPVSPPSLSPSLSHTHTHTHTPSLFLTHTHTLPLSLSHTHSLSLSLRYVAAAQSVGSLLVATTAQSVVSMPTRTSSSSTVISVVSVGESIRHPPLL